MNKLRRPGPSAQRGAAALIVVLLLFFIISLVAAYAGRSLIFEQRTSANQYRATQAFEAAEAGLEWALAMLNGGRISATCLPSANVGDRSFRERFLLSDAEDPDPQGRFEPRTWDNPDNPIPERLQPSCIRSGANWNCSCPDEARPTPELPAGSGINPAFRVCFERVPLDPSDPLGPVQPGAVRIVSTGRTTFVEYQPCEDRGEGTAEDSAATVSVVVALSSALVTPPSVGLTVRGDLDLTANMRLVPNFLSREQIDEHWMPSGWLIQVGGAADDLELLRPVNVHGTPIKALVARDPALGGLTPGQMFTSLFNMDMDTYKKQPATVVLNDCATACSSKLLAAWQANPGRMLWVEGDMTVEADMNLGTDDNPVLIVATGNINLDAALVQIKGLLYSQAATWDNGGSDGVNVQGAAVAEGNFTGSGFGADNPWVQYQADILNQLKLFTGSFVRVPGSWRDFQ